MRLSALLGAAVAIAFAAVLVPPIGTADARPAACISVGAGGALRGPSPIFCPVQWRAFYAVRYSRSGATHEH